ncbi:phytoene/squalene synthase family protein [Xanthomonas citri pv. fuscans CFBP 6996]|uniref:phytoene/squalene synthase family protein n=1 Tax=Xanthomonas citri TaxID=346 RepID=UPI000C1A221D|nr:phytoene/squalene synthase family protein [Xanthomonas citri]ATS52040.1 phytoene/squalene synthase family protein [Xanthomonas citri pv. phaseoli var. fuscans]ATS53875.1 phytoene/squalene synthase family protein [Xanthomonas citri pv. phaseoli var. fuscans]ATS58335.1 phytoene/squalene synthase family protein [Xanthomonas citri pv. phaseoli var. fuscans]PTY29727.1 phytoene/squalene synthase family protein [Xanthomonas citri pv. fuscans CFBP 6996]QWN16640.1 phytoene/squalene synthase family p
MSQSSALDSFLDKWATRWPEWSVAEPFVPEPQRRLAVAWFALLQEWEDIMNIAGDPLPADAKLAWWQQELRDWSSQRSRHPLGRVLEPVRAPWSQLADTLPAMQAARVQPQSLQHALGALRTFAEAVVAVEAVLFARARPGDATAVAVQWLDARQRVAGDSAAPGGVATAAWRTQLLQAWPRKVALARPHRVWSRLARLRLQRALSGRTAYPPPVQQLWHSWRAASGTD